jgi:effector-binding domain-containing protein
MAGPLVDGRRPDNVDPQPIEIVEIAPQPTAALRVSTTMAQFPEAVGQAFDDAVAAITAAGAGFAGPPYTRYLSFGEGEIEAEVGFPVAGPFTASGKVEPSSLPGGRVVTTVHVGSYHEIAGTWQRVQTWIEEHGLTVDGPAWESYLTDPATDPDPATWRTELRFPLR